MNLLNGKVALITGASRGIGRAMAQKFAQEGAAVAVTELSGVEKAQALEDELRAGGGYRSDASDHQAADDLVTQVVADFGKLDVLINNAGITDDGLLMRMSEEQWDSVINVNL